MATSGTSFHKKSRGKLVQIPGTRPSLHNNQLLISSGVPSLDNVLGGGLAVGTVLLVEEDLYGSYSKMVMKYFLAEGIMNKHEIHLSSADIKPQIFIDEVPGPLLDDPGPEVNKPDPDNMKIAWRYQQSQPQSATSGLKFGHYYDLTKTMDKKLINISQLTLLDIAETTLCQSEKRQGTFMRPSYLRLLNDIKQKIEGGHFGTGSTSQQRNILRIGIHSLGSPQWGEDICGGVDPSLCQFLYALRSLMRTSYCVCLITAPTILFEESCLATRLEHLCDTVIKLESFVGSDKEQNPAFKDYHGLFHIIKLPRINSLSCHTLETLDLAFKLRKKKFMIEKLHLPPELSETASRAQEDMVMARPGAGGCGTKGATSKLDF